MEIDDGTSAWGDPGAHNKSVNLWDRNNPEGEGAKGKPTPGGGGGGGNPPGPSNNHPHPGPSNNHPHPGPGNNHPHPHSHPHSHPYHGPPPPLQSHGHGPQNPGPSGGHMEPPAPHQIGPPHGRPPLMAPGWGELSSAHTKPEGWGEPSSTHTKPEGGSWGEPAPPPVSVDNGTAAWGKSSTGASCGGWGDNGPDCGAGAYGRGNPPPMGPPACKSAVKPMQEGWGGGGGGGGGEELQWDAADDGDMWSSTSSSQENNSSCNSSWSNANKKLPQKVKVPGKQQQEEAWMMNRLIKQLTDMGFPRDPAEDALKSNNMNLDAAMSFLLEKKNTDYSNKSMGGCPPPRPPLLSKDPNADPRSPFMDKMQGGMFGSSSAAAAQVRLAMQHQHAAPPPQPPVPPPHGSSSSQPNLRTASSQVPQFLSPQVQAQLLQFAAKNIGLNPALLTSPINPQHMTLLNQLYQLQLAYQRLQIQQQMLQAQRNVSGPIRQQEQQVARTINNMQQQIQQHQRQLAQALLMKQQQPPPPPGSHAAGLAAGLHPSQAKSGLDSFPGHPQALGGGGGGGGLPDLHTKEQQSSPNAYSPYSNLSGLNPNMNVTCMEALSMKEPPHAQPPQSRLSQWTHPNAMDSLPGSPSPLEASLQNKHGANLGPPGKLPQMEDGYGPYSMMSSSEAPSSPLLGPDSWGPQVKNNNNNDKMANGTNINWPPEFCPGVPWKGLQSIDPETDPNATPGSVPSGPTINTNIQDVNRYLMRDRSAGSSPSPPSQNEALPPDSDWPVSAYSSSFSLSSPETDDAGKLSDMKSTWPSGGHLSSHGQASLSHELWKVPQGPRGGGGGPGGSSPGGGGGGGGALSRPPPGLSSSKPSSTWGGNALGLSQGWSSNYSSAGTAWSTDSSNRTSSWLVLRNLTPQIDGCTLRTLCMQHGPLITFHLNLTQGNAMMRYSSRDEAAKAQKSLHMCVLGNTTILAEFAGEEEVNRFFAQGQSLGGGTTSWQASPATNQTRGGGGVPGPASHPPIGQSPHWNNNNGGGAKTGGDLGWGGGVQQYSSLWGPPGGEEGRVMGSPTPINTLLPGDLLSGESM